MTERIRVGFVGGVRHARQYAQVLLQDPRVQLVGIADDPSVPDWIAGDSAALAETLGVVWSTAPADFLRAERIDLAVVCTEPTRHAASTLLALDAGVAVCSDKPLATDLAGGIRVRDAQQRTGGTVAIVNRTFAPSLQRLRGWVDAGSVGLPRHLDVEFLTSSAAMAGDVESPRLVVDPVLSGGGELRNFLGYAVDAIRMVSGAEVVGVYAEMDALFDGPHREYGVEDTGVVSLQLQHGVTATVTVSRAPAVPTFGTAHSSIRLIGSHGYAVVDDETPRVLQFGGATVQARTVGGGGGTVAVERFFDDLIGRLRAGDRPAYGVPDALAAVAVVDAAYRSALSGRSETPEATEIAG